MNNIIYILLAFAMLLITEAQAKIEIFLGAQGGYNIVNAKLRRYTQFDQVAFNVNDKSDISKGSALGGAFAELRHTCEDSYFLSAQINGFLSNFKITNTTVVNAIKNRISTSLKMKDSVGGALRLGPCFKNILPYAKLGIARSRWKSKTHIRPGFNGAGSRKRSGIEFGVGFDVPLECNFFIGAEFSHLIYKKISYQAFNGAGQSRVIVIRPRENRIMLSLKYKLMDY